MADKKQDDEAPVEGFVTPRENQGEARAVPYLEDEERETEPTP